MVVKCTLIPTIQSGHELREGDFITFRIRDNRVPNKTDLLSRTWETSRPRMMGTGRLTVMLDRHSQNLK